MNESKAIKIIKQEMGWESKSSTLRAFEEAIKALEEVQRWHTSVINPNIKNEFANTSTQICHNCDHKDEYIEELEAEVEEYRAIGTAEELQDMKSNYFEALSDWRQYRKIGTLEECRAAVEKQTAKKVKSISQIKDGDSYVGLIGRCPCCGDILEEDTVYCDCGQKLDWGDEE